MAIHDDARRVTKDAQLDDFIAEAISTGNPQICEIGLGDLHFSGEAVVRGTDLTIQSRLSTRVHSDYRLEARFQPS